VSIKDRLSRITKWTPLPALMLLIVVLIVGGATTSYFLQLRFISSIWQTYMPVILISLGSAVVIIGGGIDLSIGTIASLVNVICIYLIKKMGWDTPPALLIGIAVGLLFGALNGVLISVFRLNALIATFAMAGITGGLALWIVPQASAYTLAADLSSIYKSYYLGIPTPFYLLILALAAWYIIMGTSAGPQIYAMGNDLKRAYITGINVTKTRIVTFIFSGFTAALAGIAMIGIMGGAFASVGGEYTLVGIAACVIGGISLFGGIGSALGGVIGGFFLAFLTALVLAVNIDPYFQELTKNAIILMSIIVPSAIKMLARRKSG
jgi:ribose transport system permease protein